ncbi:MAG: helix-hairpin-helix domain-containing protein [Armatimonadota bacterium]
MRWYFSRIEQYAVAVLLLAILGALFVLSYAYGKRAKAEDEGQPFFQPAPTANASATNAVVPAVDAQVVVHVAGAVKIPGIYRLPPNSRIYEAVRQAGGTTAEGCPDALNLAARVEDGEKIYIPTKAEWERSAAQQLPELTTTAKPAKSTATSHAAANGDSAQPGHGGPKPLPTGKININAAGLEQLTQLPGVGPVTAQHIIEYRKQKGKFSDTSELLNVPKIGPKTLEKIVPYITL